MSVFVGHNHFLYNLLNVLIGGFHCAIHIWSIRRRVMVLELELRVEFSDHSVVEVGTIVLNDSLGDAILTDKIMFDETGNHILGNRGKQGCFNPLREIICGNEDEPMPIGSGGFDFSNHINAPHCK